MTKEQFIAGCVMCRICDKATAQAYAEDKAELTKKDFDVLKKKRGEKNGNKHQRYDFGVRARFDGVSYNNSGNNMGFR